MHFMYLNTKSQLIKRVLGLQEKLSEYKGYYEHFRGEYKRVSKEISDQNELIKVLEDKLKRSERKLSREIFLSELECQSKLQEKDDEIKHLQQQLEHEKDATNGYKKSYNELKQKETKEVNFTINQINADVWKMIRYKTFPHTCTEECFEEHVIPAIQRDYDSIDPKYKESNEAINYFLDHWEERLRKNYNFIYCLYIGKKGNVLVSFKK